MRYINLRLTYLLIGRNILSNCRPTFSRQSTNRCKRYRGQPRPSA